MEALYQFWFLSKFQLATVFNIYLLGCLTPPESQTHILYTFAHCAHYPFFRTKWYGDIIKLSSFLQKDKLVKCNCSLFFLFFGGVQSWIISGQNTSNSSESAEPFSVGHLLNPQITNFIPFSTLVINILSCVVRAFFMVLLFERMKSTREPYRLVKIEFTCCFAAY